MIKKLTILLKEKFEIFILILIIITSSISITYFNHNKNVTNQNYNDLINNIYLKKTLNNIVNNLEPKYKKVNHKIKSGETFDKILNN